jgi:hypothetical protein
MYVETPSELRNEPFNVTNIQLGGLVRSNYSSELD